MNDLALQAGISRPTLYGVFSNKEEVLLAVLRTLSDRTMAAIEAELLTATNLSKKLDIAFEHAVLKGYESLSSSTDAFEVLSSVNNAGKYEIARGNERFRALMERLLIEHEAEVRTTNLTRKKLSDFIQNAARGCRNTAKDEAHLKKLLNALKALVLA